MRPSLLDPLFAGAASLPGVGPKIAKLFDRLVGENGRPARVVDVLFHLPHATIDRRARPKVRDAEPGSVVTLELRIVEHRPPGNRRSRAPWRVIGEDDTGDVMLVFFLARPGWIEHALPVGATRWVSGKIELWEGHRQMVHPDRVMDAAALEKLDPVEPVYGLTDGLFPRVAQRAAAEALRRLPARMPEWQDARLLGRTGWPDFQAALESLHRPRTPEAAAPASPARARLAYDEMLAGQLALGLVRAHMRRPPGRCNAGPGALAGRIAAALPWSLTAAQQRARADIRADMASDRRMSRLLQGDVGSGKTIVAALAMADTVEAGRQAALLAPTDVLARQHFARLQPLFETAGVQIRALTGRDGAAHRRSVLAALANGEISVLVGTHALLQDEVRFSDLGLGVIDEQHRFGVHQRLALGDKGAAVDALVMTATPIPRTLALTCFGDLDCSDLREKPPGRQPIDTRAMPSERLEEVIAAVGRAMAAGARVYWVCPLVEESAASDLTAAADRHAGLAQRFGADRVGLVHGQMKGAARDAAMAAFQSGAASLLVATTVIEVGVDVPEATVMVIEHAERFGLAQLHQLRGRVGRGAGRSTCLLLYKAPLGETAAARLSILRETEDGFRIAEEDLRLRGEGEALGARQSGMPGFRLADPAVHGDLLGMARQEARLLLASDPDLSGPRGPALRTLLYLFERDEAARLLRAG